MDKYLITGQVCEVWDKIETIQSLYFINFDKDNKPVFGIHPTSTRTLIQLANYRPIGTEWDFAPDWAVCSTVDKNGVVSFWSNTGVQSSCERWYSWSEVSDCYGCGICPDKSRYQGDAWKTSLRMRPDWAKEITNGN